MLEPIDIDINMHQNISEEAPKATAASDEMTKSVDSMQKEIERLNKVVVDMSTALAEQRKLVEAGGDEMAEYAKKVEASQAALEKAEKELAVYQGTAEQMNKAVQEGADVTKVLQEAREGLAETEAALIDNAEELVANQGEINEALEYGQQKTEIYSASNQLFSLSIKKICDALGLENSLVKSSLSNVRLIATAKDAWRGSVAMLNKELGITIAQSKKALALTLVTGIGAIVAAVGLAVYAYREYTKEQRIANKLLEEEKKLNREATAAVQEKVSHVQILDKVLSDSNRTYNERNNALKQLKNIMPDYNAQLTKEGELIRDNTGALQKYIDKLLDQELAKRTISKLADAKTAYKEWEDSLSEWQKNNLNESDDEIDSRFKNKWDRTGAKLQRDTRLARQKKLNDEIDRLDKLAQSYVSSDATTAQDNTKGYWEEQKKQAEDLLATMTDLEKGSKKWNDAVAKYKEAEGKLKAWDFKTKKPTSPKATPEEKATTTLEKKAYDYQKRINDARVKAIHDGAEKERQAAKAEYDQTQAFIEKELKQIAELEKKTGKPANEQRTLLLGLDVEATRQYEAEIGRINAQSKATLNEIFTEVSARFASELDSNIASINHYYTELINEATKAGATLVEIDRLRNANSKQLELAKIESQFKTLDFEQDIATKNIEIANKRYIFESDRIKKLLELERDFAAKRLALSLKQHKKSPTTETEQQVKSAKVAVDKLNKSIEEQKTEKMKEIAGYATMLVGSLQDISGIDLSMLNNLISGISSFKDGDMIGVASSGLGVVTSVLNNILNKSAQEAMIKQELLRLQREYNVALRQQNFDLIESVNYVRLFKDNLEALHWLVEKGFIVNADYSTWEVLSKQSETALDNLKRIKTEQDNLVSGSENFLQSANFKSPTMRDWKRIQDAWKEGKTNTADAMIALGKLGKDSVLTNMGEQIKNNNEETQKWLDELKELAQQMDEFATGTSFDGFLDSAMTAIDNLRLGIGDVADFTEEALTKAILSSFKYQVLAAALKPFYEQLSDKFITDFDGLDKAWAEDWKSRLQAELGEKAKVLDDLFDSMGIDSQGERQGATGGFASASQDSINELTGGVYAVRQMLGDMRQDNREELLVSRTIASQMSVLVERSEDWKYLKELPNVVKKLDSIEAYGLKMRI